MNLAETIQEIDRLKVEIDFLRPIDAIQEQKIMQKFRLDWNYHSNAIEGNSLSLGETRAFLFHGITASGKPFKDYLDIKGHNEAVEYLEDMVRFKEPISEANIRELHKILLVEPYEVKAVTEDGLPTSRTIQIGQYKSVPNHVKTKTGETFFFATPSETPAMMNELVSWLRDSEKSSEIHPLIIAATFHYRFVRIHPFDDGNGRMARLLMNLILMRAGFPPVVIRLEDKEGEYFPALEIADAENDLEPLTLFVGNELLRSEQLYLRGAKGYGLEEDSDFEKKISLLQQRIDTQKQKQELQIASEKETVVKRIEELVFPFVEELLESTQKLSVLFETHSATFWVEKGSGWGFHNIEEFSRYLSDFDDDIFDGLDFNVRFDMSLRKFKADKDLGLRTEFSLNKVGNDLYVKAGEHLSSLDFLRTTVVSYRDDDLANLLRDIAKDYGQSLLNYLQTYPNKND